MENQQLNNNPQPQVPVSASASASEETPANGWYKATVLRRWVASLIDGLILMPIILLSVSFYKSAGANFMPNIILWGYSVFFIWRFGATLGKKLLKIQVVDTNYQPVSLWKAFLREVIGKFISGLIFGLGYLWAIWDKDRQTWHDKIAGTYVVTKIPNNGKNSIGLFIIVALFTIIPIIAILAAVVVLIINPLELMKRSRDAARLTDLAHLQQAINVAVQESTQSTSLLACAGVAGDCAGWSNSGTRVTTGTGWVKVDLGASKSVTVPTLPIDPLNNDIYYYRYCSDGKDWEIETKLESEMQKNKMVSDGGIDPAMYEIGSKFGLCQ